MYLSFTEDWNDTKLDQVCLILECALKTIFSSYSIKLKHLFFANSHKVQNYEQKLALQFPLSSLA